MLMKNSLNSVLMYTQTCYRYLHKIELNVMSVIQMEWNCTCYTSIAQRCYTILYALLGQFIKLCEKKIHSQVIPG